MVEYMEQLTITEAESLKKVVKELFRQTCILQVKYDPVTLIPRDNKSYQVCYQHRKFIEDYMSVIGCELYYEPQEHIFYITGEGAVSEKLNEITTLLILMIKLIYRDKIMGQGLQATTTTLSEIREYGRNTGLITRKLTVQEWREALAIMKTHQIIELPMAMNELEDQTPIYIYGTINIYCSSTDINELIKKYQEDVEDIIVTEDEEDMSDTIEEKIHENVIE